MMSSLINTDVVSSPFARGNASEEFRSLLTVAGAYSLANRAKIALTGEDRTRWLNGVITNNVRDLQAGHGLYAFLLNPQGHILGDLYVYNRGNSLMVDVEVAQLPKVMQHFDHYIIMDDVEVADVSQKLAGIGMVGPTATAVLEAIGLEAKDLAPLQFADLVWEGIDVTLIRSDGEGLPRFELWTGPALIPKLLDALIKAGAVPVGPQALEWLRIASGVPRIGQDIRERDLPQETEQQRALNFNKGCYIGQEIVERIRSRGAVHRRFTGFVVDGPPPTSGMKVQADGKDLGEITSASSLPLDDSEFSVALGYLRREAATGRPLMAGESTLHPVKLPFEKVFRH